MMSTSSKVSHFTIYYIVQVILDSFISFYCAHLDSAELVFCSKRQYDKMDFGISHRFDIFDQDQRIKQKQRNFHGMYCEVVNIYQNNVA